MFRVFNRKRKEAPVHLDHELVLDSLTLACDGMKKSEVHAKLFGLRGMGYDIPYFSFRPELEGIRSPELTEYLRWVSEVHSGLRFSVSESWQEGCKRRIQQYRESNPQVVERLARDLGIEYVLN